MNPQEALIPVVGDEDFISQATNSRYSKLK
jgi:hypothetical protein